MQKFKINRQFARFLNRKFKKLLFDYDNTAALTEEVAFRACCGVVNKVLAKFDAGVRFNPEELLAKFVGKSFRQMILDLSAEHGFTVPADELERLVEEEVESVIDALGKDLVECEGFNEVLEWASAAYTVAVVSSSAMRRLQACIKKLAQERFFDDRVFSASSSLPTPKSKPDPAVYLFALEVLGALAEDCLAVEDSASGVKAAVAAGIAVVAYVGAYSTPAEQDEMAAKLTELGACAVMYHWNQFAEILAILEGAEMPAVVA